MSNSLAEVHPELVSEWSEKNLTLTPDDIHIRRSDRGRENLCLYFFSGDYRRCSCEWKRIF